MAATEEYLDRGALKSIAEQIFKLHFRFAEVTAEKKQTNKQINLQKVKIQKNKKI